MTLESLRWLCAIIETRSFRAAAERLHRSQPAVSQQLKVLEREAGQSLVDRKTGMPTAGAIDAHAVIFVERNGAGAPMDTLR